MKQQRNVFALVIDDDRDHYELTKAVLSLGGYTAIVADNAADGLELYRQYRPFLIITDFGMPEVDGAELIRMLRRNGAQETPIVVVSAFSPDYIRKNLYPGFEPDAILTKPLEFDQLLKFVRSCDQSRQVQPPSYSMTGNLAPQAVGL